MTSDELAKLADEELQEVAKNNRPSPIIDAFFIGFLIGIVIYGVVSNAFGFFALVPLFMVYLFLKKPKQYRAIQDEMKSRGLN
jgi:hypothetical protein